VLAETPGYVVLEVFINESYSFSADICSLECIVCEMMVENHLFFIKTLVEKSAQKTKS
jgi:hypothetical protein